jgi:1-acyl-sn-glycerol-3-phosphate acyltransferase
MLKTDIVWRAPLPEGPKIIAANHPTTNDPFYIMTLLSEQMGILVTEAAFTTPVLGRYLRKAGHLPAVRQSRGATVEALKRQIDAGRTVVIFPEGALSPSKGRFQEPHTGVARLALTTGAPVVPVGISLQHEHVRIVETQEAGKPVVDKFYMRGPYAMTVGEPLWIQGDVTDRAYVRLVSRQIMQHIINLSRESAQRLQAAPMFELGLFPRFVGLHVVN